MSKKSSNPKWKKETKVNLIQNDLLDLAAGQKLKVEALFIGTDKQI